MIPVSVIIPAYIRNEEQVQWLQECIESVGDASEIIVVDDASPISIAKVIIANPHVRWYRFDENSGSATARNTAVSLATNELIFPLDADDMIVPGGLAELYNRWQGTPLYPDLYHYYYKENEKKVHVLREFDCEEIKKYCGVASVNVLHTVSQWRSIGGWREDIRYLEDAEYNSRLMYIYCGVHISKPLILYRMHEFQKTVHKKKSNAHVTELYKIQGEIRRISGMGCCGGRSKKKVTNTRTGAVMTPQASRNIPGVGIPGETADLVQVVYTGGKGKGAHYYKGLVTRHGYKVKYGAKIFVDPRDAAPTNSMFERIVDPTQAPKQAKEVVAERDPKEAVRKFPIMEGTDLPDIMNISYNDVISILNDMQLSDEDIQKLHNIESQGRSRKRVMAWLQRRMK